MVLANVKTDQHSDEMCAYVDVFANIMLFWIESVGQFTIEREVTIRKLHSTCTEHNNNTMDKTQPTMDTKGGEEESLLDQAAADKCYTILHRMGASSSSQMFKAVNKTNDGHVVLKMMPDHKDTGFNLATLREMRILQEIKHANIVKLIEVCNSTPVCSLPTFEHTPGAMFLVLEYCEHDLGGLLSPGGVHFSLAQKKMIMKQIFSGLEALHHHRIMHRDLKVANVLVNSHGTIKLANFNHSRAVADRFAGADNADKTNRWYRAPEVLLGDVNYGTAIDMWAAGLIMFQLWPRLPILPGTSNYNQLCRIVKLCGSITTATMPDSEQLRNCHNTQLPTNEQRQLLAQARLVVDDDLGVRLINRLMQLNPSKRLTAHQALGHPFFHVQPMAEPLGDALAQLSEPMYNGSHYLPHLREQLEDDINTV